MESKKELTNILNNIIDIVPGHLYVKDLEGRYLFCNKKQADSLLMKVSDIIGKTDYDLSTKNNADKYRNIEKEIIETGKTKIIEEPVYYKDKPGIVLSIKSPLCDELGNITGIIGISIDITKKKEAELVKLKSENQKTAFKYQNELNNLALKFDEQEVALDNILANLPGHVYWVDKRNIFLGCNDQQAFDFNLKSRHQIKGLNVTSFQTPENAETIIKNNNRVIKNGEIITEEENFQSLDGKDLVYFSKKVPLKNQNGEVIGLLGVSIDITAQKEAERLRLENKYQEKSRKLAEQAIHDIKSPLSTLKNLAHFTKSMTEKERHAVINAMNSIEDIANNLLHAYTNPNMINKIQHNMLVSTILLKSISSKRYQYQKESKVKFEIDIAPDAYFAFIRMNSGDFQRMMSNLINNSIDALAGKKNKRIEIEVSQNGEEVVISITDNGKGMPQEIIDKIYNKSQVTYEKDNGHGVGWVQIQETIKNNFGRFVIYSTLGKETKVIMAFPKVNAPNYIISEIKLCRNDIVVIIDDEPSVHMAWESRLSSFLEEIPGLQIKHFSLGNEAIDFIDKLTLKEKKHVYLLTDYELIDQDLNGLDIIRLTKIKRSILVTSHYAKAELQEEAKKLRIKIIPKELTFAVSVKYDKQIKPHSKKVDFVWVDDNLAWMEGVIQDHYNGLIIDKYAEPLTLMEEVKQYPYETKFILDMFYTNVGVYKDGFETAMELYNLGYKNLYMAAGETITGRIPEYLKVIYKDDVVGLAKLAQS